MKEEKKDNEVQLRAQSTDLVQGAKELKILNEEGYEYAIDFVKQVKTANKEVTAYFEPMRVSTKAAYDSVLAKKRELIDPLKEAEKVIKGKIGEYQDRIEAEEAEKEALEASRRAEEEVRLATVAEAAAAGDEDAEMELALFGLGDVTPTEEKKQSAPAGVTTTKTPVVEVTNPHVLVDALQSGEVFGTSFHDVIEFNTKLLARLVKKHGMESIPGCRITYRRTQAIKV